MKRGCKYFLTSALAVLMTQAVMAQAQQSEDEDSQQKPAVNADFLLINQSPNRHEATIYPNPSKGGVVKIKSSILIKNVEIMTMIGKCVQSERNLHMIYDDITLTLNSCNPGTYYAKITFEDDQTVIKKLIVRK